MDLVDGMFSKDEEKYFESKGRDEPERGEPEARQDIQDEPDATAEPIASQRHDGTYAESDGGEEESRLSDDVVEEEADRPANARKSSTRDFEKAYGIAESKRVELRQQLENQARQNQALKQQLDAVIGQMQQPAANTALPPVPDKDEDPLGYYNYQLQYLGRTVSQQQQYLAAQAERERYNQQINGLKNAYRQSAAQFAQEQTDFADAYHFLEKSRIEEYMAAGYNAKEAESYLHEDEMAIAAKAFREGANPAERVYNAARARGYNPSLKGPGKLAQVENGLRNAKSLGSSKTKAMKESLDISMVDEMNEDEFNRYFNQVKEEQKKANNYHKGW